MQTPSRLTMPPARDAGCGFKVCYVDVGRYDEAEDNPIVAYPEDST